MPSAVNREGNVMECYIVWRVVTIELYKFTLPLPYLLSHLSSLEKLPPNECVCCCYSGIAYVTYSKASEAALAIEEMNGKSLKDTNRSIKVIITSLPCDVR